MHLRDRRARERLVVERRRRAPRRRAEVGGDHLANRGCGQRGDAVLQLLHLEDELGAEEVGPHRDQLAQLDERRPEPLEGDVAARAPCPLGAPWRWRAASLPRPLAPATTRCGGPARTRRALAALGGECARRARPASTRSGPGARRSRSAAPRAPAQPGLVDPARPPARRPARPSGAPSPRRSWPTARRRTPRGRTPSRRSPGRSHARPPPSSPRRRSRGRAPTPP